MRRALQNLLGYAAMTCFYLFAGLVVYYWWRGA